MALQTTAQASSPAPSPCSAKRLLTKRSAFQNVQENNSSEQKCQPQNSAAAGSGTVLSFIIAWNYTHCYSCMPSECDSQGIQEHRQSHPAQSAEWNRQGQSRGWGCVTGHVLEGTEDFPHNFSQVNETKRNKQVKEAKQYFIVSHKTDMDCIQPWKTSYFLKSWNYKWENSFLINNLTPFLHQKIVAWNRFPLQFN